MALFSARSFLPSPPEFLPPVATGKIPTYPEFLHTRPIREPERSFDGWLEGGVGLAVHEYGPAWHEAFEVGDVRGFVWRAPNGTSDTLLSGLLFPSCDAVGRRYPLAVTVGVPARLLAQAPHVLPLAFADFLERAHTATLGFHELRREELQQRIGALAPPTEEDVAAAIAEYDGWCASTPIEGVWSAILASGSPDGSIAILRALVSATESIRGVEQPAEGVSLRLPLGQGGPAMATLWLDIIRRLAVWRHTVPTTFWAVSEGSLIVSLGDAPPGVLSSLWYPPSRHVYDLTAPPASDEDWRVASGPLITDLLASLGP